MSGSVGRVVCCLAMVLAVSQSAPLREARDSTVDKMTCLTRSDAKGWKKCDEPASISTLPTYESLYFEAKLRNNEFPQIQVPQNGFECFRVHRFDTNSAHAKCPAFCWVRGVVERNEGCEENHTPLLNQFGRVTIMSPKNSCDSNSYRPENEICIYNISMACAENHVSVTDSHLNLATKDFLQVIELSKKDAKPQSLVYTSTANGTWPENRRHIYSNNFLVVFWTEEGPKDGHDGFMMGFDCPAGSTDTPSADGSGDQLAGLSL